jgi:hypothetical protein
MGYVGVKPSAVPLTSADITDGIITSAKIADGTIVNADINASAGITSAKLDDLANPFGKELLHVRDEKVANTSGGTFTSGAWRTRTLNTSVTNEISGASLSSNQITLPSGTYYIFGSANVGYAVGTHAAKLRNTTDSSDTIIGSSEYVATADGVSNKSFVIGRFTISAQKVFELQHQCSNTVSTDGFGVNISFVANQVFADVQIWKVA